MDEITSASMQRLLGVNKSVLNDLVKHGIVQHGKKRGCTGMPPAGVPAFVLAQLRRSPQVREGGINSAYFRL